jgi:hypothetical protein
MYVWKKQPALLTKNFWEIFFIYKEWTGGNSVQSQIWGGLCYEEILDPESFQICLFFLTVCGTAQTRISPYKYRGRIQGKTWCMRPYARIDYNLTLCPLQSRLQHIYHGQP